MKPAQEHGNVSRKQWHLAGGLLALSAFLYGCATAIRVETNPPGAMVTVNGQSIGTTPAQYQAQGSKPLEVQATLSGYFPEYLTYAPDAQSGQGNASISLNLERSQIDKAYEVVTDPDGVTLTLEGKSVGTTPATVPVTYTRSGKKDPWTTKTLELSKANYQSEKVTLSVVESKVAPVKMSLLKDDRTYSISATNLDGDVLAAEVTIDGKAVGTTPLKLPIVYQRADKTQPWPRFNVVVEIPGRYKPSCFELYYDRETTIHRQLEAVTEIVAKVIAPEVVMTPTGAAFKVIERPAVATLNLKDDSTSVSDFKMVTSYQRQDMRPANRIESISSFTVTPDGQSVVYALSETDENGNRYSNLYIKRADDSSGGVSRLTQGNRFMDVQPYIANYTSNYLVFASNRGYRAKPDIFRVNLVESRLTGGISRLTSDNRFNSGPTYGDSNRQLFFLSTEPAFPKAEPQISSIRFDGSLPTQLPNVAVQINNAYPEKVFFVRVDEDTGKKQIYSITADGKLETALINQEDFRRANCYDPCVSSDGQRVLFTADHGTGTGDRPNSDIYLINADGSGLQRLTYNESDDFAPQWSPTEEGVVFFISTRGGATNIWRLKLVTGR